MHVVVTGGTGVLGRSAVPALIEARHEVSVLCRRAGNRPVIEALGARPVDGDIFDPDSLSRAFAGADAVVNLATNVPVGYLAALPRSWRRHDELRTRGVASVVEAARTAGVRRVVQESVSTVYADQGDAWIDESSPLEIIAPVEPAAVAESLVQRYSCDSRAGVILRLGQIVGDDAMTHYFLKSAMHGRPIGLGSPGQWAHVLHSDDVGSAVAAALVAPQGCYNVGAAPVRKGDLMAAYAAAAGVDEVGFMGAVLRRMAGPRIDPYLRSLRVCSERFSSQTGWRPSRQQVDESWIRSASLAGVTS